MKGTQEPHTIQPEDLFRWKFPRAQLSPDGKTILYD